jgi:hypothetical protein
VTVYWVSYLEGPQRVLLFTQDERIACQARSNIDSEKSSLELFLSFSGIGVSLVSANYVMFKVNIEIQLSTIPRRCRSITSHIFNLSIT